MHLFLLSPFATMAYSCFPSNRQDSDLGKHYNYPKYPIKYISRVYNINFHKYNVFFSFGIKYPHF